MNVLIALVACSLVYTVRTGRSFTYAMGEFPAPWGNEIRAGVLEGPCWRCSSVVMLCSVWRATVSWRWIWMRARSICTISLINLMTAALLAMVWTNDIFTGYVFLEILTLTSCGILIVREIGRTTLAAVRYMILNLLGSGLFLLGVVMLYTMTGHLLMVPMQKTIARLAADPRGHACPLTMAVGI